MDFSEIFDLKSCWKLLPKTKIRQLRSGNYKFAACLPPPRRLRHQFSKIRLEKDRLRN